MTEPRILVLEDSNERLIWFRMATIGFVVDYALTAEQAIQLLTENEYTQIFLDHDLNDDHMMSYFRDEPLGKHDETTGFAVAKFLGTSPDVSRGAEIIVHSINPEGAKRMVRELHAGRRHYRQVNFGLLKETASKGHKGQLRL